MENAKVLMCHNPERIDVPVDILKLSKGDVISVSLYGEFSFDPNHQQNNPMPDYFYYDPYEKVNYMSLQLKIVANKAKQLSMDLSAVLKTLEAGVADLWYINAISFTPVPIIFVKYYNENNERPTELIPFYLFGGSEPTPNIEDIINKRLSTPSQEPNLTFFKGYPQYDTFLVEHENRLYYRTIERDSDYVYHQGTLRRASDNIQRVVDECGVFLRWRNSWGGWSYWLFDEKYTEEIKSKSLGHMTKPLEITEQRLFHFGFSATKQWVLTSKIPPLTNEMAELKTLLTSPEVYLYRGEKGERLSLEKTNIKKWERVAVSSGNHKFKENEHVTSPFNVTIEFQDISTIKKI